MKEGDPEPTVTPGANGDQMGLERGPQFLR